MIIIFGGTTEGRLAIDACEKAGTPYYYSTKTDWQDIEMHHGVHLSGGLTDEEMTLFCREKGIQCIIDAAHPFAENLHRNIAKASESVGIPVIRIERSYHNDASCDATDDCRITLCNDYADAIRRMEEAKVEGLLALSGANTISKLKPFWQKHRTIFRILKRRESMDIAEKCGLSKEDIIYYDDSLKIPSVETETKTITELLKIAHIDAMLTKESGASGGFEAKVKAAMECGLKVFVVKKPAIRGEENWTKVTGQYGLRRAIELLVPDFFPLHTGFTTGACATAAVKAAAIALLTGDNPEEVCFALPNEEVMKIGVEEIVFEEKENRKASATVIKPDNDDADVTKGCRITAMVSIRKDDNEIHFLQGKGVGTVTLPGLGIAIGEPAINPTPRKMMTAELRQLNDCGFDVVISVENGDEIAKRTFNEKVGVMGGISIIGTSGIVHPFSNEAFIECIRREMKVAKAMGCTEMVLVSGMKTERILREEHKKTSTASPKRYYLHYGNFIGEAMKAAEDSGFPIVTLGIMIGKAVKLAEGNLDTHSHKVQMNKDFLISLAPEHEDKIASVSMARELWGVMPQSFFDTITKLCHKHCRSVFPNGQLNVRIIKDQ